MLTRIERSLDKRAPFGVGFPFNLSWRNAVVALVASAGVLIGGLVIWQFVSGPSHSHEVMVRNFGEFLAAYEQGQPSAVDVLPQKYQGTLVSEAAATSALKHETVARPIVLANYQATKRYLLKMPCCNCVQTVYARNGTTSFVLFEHDKDQPKWFGARPMIRAECSGKSCCLVQLKSGLAASWPVDGSFVTVVGVRDIAELENLIDELRPQ